MDAVIFILTLFVVIRTAAYGVWVIKKEKNIAGSICVFVICAALAAVSVSFIV